jgi:monoamine oxidase
MVVADGDVRRYKGLIPKIGLRAVASLAIAMARLDRMAKTLPLDDPWDAERAAEWDARTIQSFVAKMPTQIARTLFDGSTRGLFTGDLSETSLLDFLFLIRSAGNLNTLLSIKGGYQENLVEGGAGAIAQRMAADLGEAVKLAAPVRTIAQTNETVTVSSEAIAVTARRAVVTAPPALVLEITFDPALPDDRTTLYRSMIGGPETKTLVVYDEPFWRSDGLSGQMFEPGAAAEVTLDASPASGAPGVIAAFTFGPVAEKWDALSPDVRRKAVLDVLTARLGPRAASPVEYVETAWLGETWTRGCSMYHFPPGILTRYGRLLRQPLGRVHFAGTETATMSHGAMDGAARSGERAAAEILART